MNFENPEFCMLNQLRRATRTLGQQMDAAMSVAGIKSTQFSLLVTLSKTGKMRLTHLANVLMLERTSLTRNLQPLLDKGWVEKVSGKDQRVKLVSITSKGLAKIEEVSPMWRAQQKKWMDNLGEQQWASDYQAVLEITHET